MTAYFGLLDVGKLKEGDTVVVSGAAGAVGSVAGQIAKIKGARVIGIAGGETSAAGSSTTSASTPPSTTRPEDVRRALRESAPDGVDVYFDNVGGEILDAVLTRLARGARIVICGAVSQYNATDGVRGPANYLSLLVARASMTGMVVFDYATALRPGRERDRRLDGRRTADLARGHPRGRRRRHSQTPAEAVRR